MQRLSAAYDAQSAPSAAFWRALARRPPPPACRTARRRSAAPGRPASASRRACHPPSCAPASRLFRGGDGATKCSSMRADLERADERARAYDAQSAHGGPRCSGLARRMTRKAPPGPPSGALGRDAWIDLTDSPESWTQMGRPGRPPPPCGGPGSARRGCTQRLSAAYDAQSAPRAALWRAWARRTPPPRARCGAPATLGPLRQPPQAAARPPPAATPRRTGRAAPPRKNRQAAPLAAPAAPPPPCGGPGSARRGCSPGRFPGREKAEQNITYSVERSANGRRDRSSTFQPPGGEKQTYDAQSAHGGPRCSGLARRMTRKAPPAPPSGALWRGAPRPPRAEPLDGAAQRPDGPLPHREGRATPRVVPRRRGFSEGATGRRSAAACERTSSARTSVRALMTRKAPTAAPVAAA